MKWLRRLLGLGSRADPPDDPRSFREVLQSHIRPCWKPVTSEADDTAEGSKFSGTVAASPDGVWPACGRCSEPLDLFVQLDSRDLPEEFGTPYGDGVLQLFYCTNSDSECTYADYAWRPFGESSFGRVLSIDDCRAAARRASDPNAGPARAISGWKRDTDFPSDQDADELGVQMTDEQWEDLYSQEYPRGGDKLGGWPAWVQSIEKPDCPDCGRPMDYVLQIDSEDNLDFMFGDLGCGHIHVCPVHPDRVGFGWACH